MNDDLCPDCGLPKIGGCECVEEDDEDFDFLDDPDDDAECTVCGEDLEDCLCDGEEDTNDEHEGYDDFDDF
jgi:hypothetical protein